MDMDQSQPPLQNVTKFSCFAISYMHLITDVFHFMTMYELKKNSQSLKKLATFSPNLFTSLQTVGCVRRAMLKISIMCNPAFKSSITTSRIHHCCGLLLDWWGAKWVQTPSMHYPPPHLPAKPLFLPKQEFYLDSQYTHNQTQSCPHPVSCFYSTTIWSVFDPRPDSLRLKIISHRPAIPAAQVTVYPCTFNYVTTRLCSVSIYVWSSYHVACYSSICCARQINQSKLSVSDWFNSNPSSHVFVINYTESRNLALNLLSKRYMQRFEWTVESYEIVFTVD